MAKVKLLIDTDIVIDYLNSGFLRTIFEGRGFKVYYSVLTKKELLTKPGLKEAERQAVLFTLRRHRIIPLDDRITGTYSDLRQRYPSLEKEDALIAATAHVRKLPLITRNVKHFKDVRGLFLFKGLV